MTVALIYCDHNFIISAHAGPNDYKDHLVNLARDGTLSYVLSTWHWLEMARDRDRARGLSVAAFADYLTPRWFFERRNVQRREVEHRFFEFVELPHQQQPVMGNLAEAIADLTGASLGEASQYRDSRDFVLHMQTLGEDHPLQVNIRQNFEAHRQNGEGYRTGRITDEMVKCLDKICIGGLLPLQTPSGAAVDRNTKDEFLRSCNNNQFPSFAVEAAYSLDGWRTGRVLNDRAFRDSQHVVAIPYVEYFVTDDESFAAAIRRVAEQLPFLKAEVVTKAELDRRF
jgi:hypothetical protein